VNRHQSLSNWNGIQTLFLRSYRKLGFPFLGYLLLIYFSKRMSVLDVLKWCTEILICRKYVVCLFLQYRSVFHTMLAWVSCVALLPFFVAIMSNFLTGKSRNILRWINNGIARYAYFHAHGVSGVGGSVATGLLKISPDFLSKKKNKKQIKKRSSNLQIPPKLTPKCDIILH